VKIPGLDNQQSFLKFSFSASINALVVSLLHVVALSFPAPAKCQIGLIPEESRMNIFEELKPRIDVFKATREHVVESASLPSIDGCASFGKPPFAIDDGTDYYAVIDGAGNVKPLPFGYQVSNDDIAMEGVDVVYSRPMMAATGGIDIARYVPLVEDFDMPGDRAFCLETAEDSDAFNAVGRMLDAVQAMLTEKAVFNFNQRLSNAIIGLYTGCEELESVDQAISAFSLNPSVLTVLFLRSYQHALDTLAEELSAEEHDGEE